MENFQIYKDTGGKYHFRLLASNKQVILMSQPYARKASAIKGIKSVIRSVADEKNFVKKYLEDGSYFFVLKASNGETVGKSNIYASRAGMEMGIKSVIRNVEGIGEG
ncbi:MAG: YegP family protein [Bacteroidota bacterium]